MMYHVPDRATYWADHYYDGECCHDCGACDDAYLCSFCDVRSCYRSYACSDCELWDRCHDPDKYDEEDPD